ncbi:MAG: hypothetical protein RMK49_05430 [Abditibacteriales bacterium]|nr:hypothetical protein [Abditibacteriales bacterium]
MIFIVRKLKTELSRFALSFGNASHSERHEAIPYEGMAAAKGIASLRSQ